MLSVVAGLQAIGDNTLEAYKCFQALCPFGARMCKVQDYLDLGGGGGKIKLGESCGDTTI